MCIVDKGVLTSSSMMEVVWFSCESVTCARMSSLAHQWCARRGYVIPGVGFSCEFMRASFSSVARLDRVERKMVGDVGCCGGRERWSAGCDEDTDVVTCAAAVRDMVKDVGYCVGSPMDVSEDLQEAEPDFGDEWRHWHLDGPELESGGEAVVWHKRKKGVRDRSSNTADGFWVTQATRARMMRTKLEAGASAGEVLGK